ncbi:glycoside hydrolase family 19 protein [Caldimonas brevitalea]|uniref:Chitinase n=1 Tax=Caldimonas brevitalea TaxID=413882 RepID=A0A0G3BLJ4_9BURK|nr:glycoside hydrolase family 19 protein [Caldimonas brevitalea]AKJ28853.1 chitinase [Caldimonas brevitalea]
MITVERLVAAGIAPAPAAAFAAPLEGACRRFGITSRQRLAAFVAQAAHESNGFERLEEDLRYTSAARVCKVFRGRVKTLAQAGPLLRNPRALANVVYSNRLGNGDVASDDGWRYRGRGLFQLTGRANYMAAEDAIGRPYKASPELVAEPVDAALTAAWFWAAGGMNDLADRGRFDDITRRVNGAAMLGSKERQDLFIRALGAFS